MDLFFLSFLFCQLVSTTLYLIITYVSLVTVSLSALCRLSFLALASPLSSICGPFYYCLVSLVSIVVMILLLGLSLISCHACVSLFNSTCSIICNCVYFTTCLLVFLLLLDLLCAYFLVPGLYAAPQFILWYSLFSLDLCGVFFHLYIACRFTWYAFSGISVVLMIGRSSTNVLFLHTLCT